MYWVYPTRTVEIDAEFIAHEKELLTVTKQIQPDGIEPDDQGEKWVKKGSFIDADGKVTVPTITSNSVTFSVPPVGILFSPVKVTYGPAYGAIMIKGWIKGDYFDWDEQEWSVELGEAVHKLLPEINFKDKEGHVVYGPTDNVQTFSLSADEAKAVKK